jgi:hypothetical protein
MQVSVSYFGSTVVPTLANEIDFTIFPTYGMSHMA